MVSQQGVTSPKRQQIQSGPSIILEKDSSTNENTTASDQADGGQASGLAPPVLVGSRPITKLLSAQSYRSYVDGHSHYTGGDDYEEKQWAASHQQSPEEKTFEVGWDGDDDPMNPKTWSTARKWMIVLVLGCGSLCVTFASSIYTITYEGMESEFHNSRIVSDLGVTTYLIGLGIAPMMLGPLSEFYGRRPIYIIGFSLYTIWLIPCAVARNIETMLVARFFDGLAGSAFLSVAGGTVGDMFTKETLQAPMMIYSAAPNLGPGMGPIVGGFVNYYTSWRWSWYLLLIWSGLLVVGIIFLVPETYSPVLLRNKARQKRKDTGDDRWKAPIEVHEKSVVQTVARSLYRPFLLLIFEPMCSSLCLLTAIILGVVYLFFGAFALVFKDIYGFNLWQVGMSFMGIFVGMLCVIASDPFWHYNYLRLLRKTEDADGEVKSEPEFRLPPAIAGAFCCVVGMFGFAWTIYPSIHWIVPIIFTAFFGAGITLTFTGIFTFLVEAYPLYAASALSANSFARSAFAAAFPLFGVQMYKYLGYHWASTLLAFLTTALAPFPYIFYIYGKKLRTKSRYGSGEIK